MALLAVADTPLSMALLAVADTPLSMALLAWYSYRFCRIIP
jgi:hypothetical protein